MIPKSMQASDIAPPRSDETSLAIGLSCPDCETIRFYRIDENLKFIVNRDMSGVSFSASCEKCSRRFVAVVQWITPDEGYSYRKPPTAEMVSIVRDENGLRLPQ